MGNAYKAAAFLLAVVADLEKQYSDRDGVWQSLDALKLNIWNIRQQENSDIPKTIGFFGGQKRGKSSLINQLLGCKLMPVKAIPLSSIVVRAEKDLSIPPDLFKVTITFSNGFAQDNTVSLDNANFLLENYGTRLGNFSDKVAEIHVKSNFPESKILREGGILVDTPGAEYAFGIDDPDMEVEGPVSAEAKNNMEIERAISILDKTQIIVFCERADYLENRNSQRFYQEKLNAKSPINVLNFMDKYESEGGAQYLEEMQEQKRQNEMRQKMAATFGATMDRICCVSCKDAIDGKKKNDEKLLQRSNIATLEEFILSELRNLMPEFGLPCCLDKLSDILKRTKEKSHLTVNRLYMTNFIFALNSCGEEYRETIKKAEVFL